MAKIVIDCRMPENCGIYRYTINLINELLKIDKENRYIVLTPTNTNIPWRSVQEQWQLPKLLKKMKADIFHSTSYISLRNCPCQQVITLHDVFPFKYLKLWGLGHRAYYNLIVKPAIKKGARIITDSHKSALDISKYYKIPLDTIAAIYLGLERKFLTLPEPFVRRDGGVLFVGKAKKHKNRAAVVKALRLAYGDNGERMLTETKGFVTDGELLKMYQRAFAFVMPSFYEGFGLPVLEAMGAGTPVICSDRGSLAEVGGDAALYVDPEKPDQIADWLKILEDPAIWGKVSMKGRMRAGWFHWKETARKTLEVYNATKEN